MFVNKEKINTPRFPMLHHEESPEKPQYNMLTPISRQTPYFAIPFPFQAKIFRSPLFPSTLKKTNTPPSPFMKVGSNYAYIAYIVCCISHLYKQKENCKASCLSWFDLRLSGYRYMSHYGSSYAQWFDLHLSACRWKVHEKPKLTLWKK